MKALGITIVSLLVFAGAFVVLTAPLEYAYAVDPVQGSAGTSDVGWDTCVPGIGNLDLCFRKLLAMAANAIMMGAAYLVGLAGVLLNTVIIETIVRMATYTNGTNSAVGVAWTVFRDIANIVLIFTMLVVGIATILRAEGYGMKRLLPKVIIIAILLNFSLFFCKAAIDVTNIVALYFYDAVIAKAPANSATGFQGDFSGIIMEQLRLTTLYNSSAQGINNGGGGAGPINATNLTFSAIFFIGIAGMILLLITAAVLLAAAVAFVSRFIVLVFLMMLSPLAFVASVLPATQNYWKRWLDTFIKNALFAPMYLILLWASLTVVQNMPVGNQASSFSGLWVDPASVGPLLLSFTIMIGLFVGSLMIAREMGAYGAGATLKAIDNARRSVQGFGGRMTVGLASAGASRFYDWTQTTRAGRAIPYLTAGATLGAIRDREIKRGLESGARANFGSKQSYRSLQDERKKRSDEVDNLSRSFDVIRDVEKAKTNEEMQTALSKMSNKEIEKLDKLLETNQMLVKNLTPEQLEAVMKSDAISEQRKEKIRETRFEELYSAMTEKDANERRTKIEKAVKPLSVKELEMLKVDTLKNREVIESLSGSTYDDLVKSNKIVGVVKDKMKENRLASLNEAISSLSTDPKAIDNLREELRKRKSGDIAKLKTGTLTTKEVAENLSAADLAAVGKEVDRETRDTLRTHLKALMDANGGPGKNGKGGFRNSTSLTETQKKAIDYLFNDKKPGYETF